MTGLRVNALSYQHRLHELSFIVEPGHILGVAGANGAGKSTLLRLLAGDLQANQGAIGWQGQAYDTFSLREYAQQRAWLTQSPVFMPGFTVMEVVQLGSYPFSCTQQHVQTVSLSLLKTFALYQYAQRDFGELSGGQQQRVQLARIALQLSLQAEQPVNSEYPKAKLVLLDEPLTGLDLQYRQLFLHWLQQQTNQQGWSVVLVLHELNRLLNVSDELLLLKAGQTVAYGSVPHLFTGTDTLPTINPLLSDVFDCTVQVAHSAAMGWWVHS